MLLEDWHCNVQHICGRGEENNDSPCIILPTMPDPPTLDPMLELPMKLIPAPIGGTYDQNAFPHALCRLEMSQSSHCLDPSEFAYRVQQGNYEEGTQVRAGTTVQVALHAIRKTTFELEGLPPQQPHHLLLQ
jgi:hypothetical protein